ncbi:MAG: TetR family transcriptional regulator [Spirochaetia bacterium]|nr:TetR family transcriptional regulator [Spirochaetia bacterium]
MKRTQEDAEKTKQLILDAGFRVFAEQGYYHTSMEDIARAANVTRGAVYWHFKSKEDFILAMADSIYTETSERLVLYFSKGSTFEEKITTTIKNIGYWYLEDAEIGLKRNALHSVQIGKSQSLVDKIFHSIFPGQDFPSDSDFIDFIINRICELLNIQSLREKNKQEIQEGFLLLISFVEGFISIIIRSRAIMTRAVIDNIVNKFMEGFSHSYRHILEEK